MQHREVKVETPTQERGLFLLLCVAAFGRAFETSNGISPRFCISIIIIYSKIKEWQYIKLKYKLKKIDLNLNNGIN